jgi:hypothetical protein
MTKYTMVTVEFKDLNPFRCLYSEWIEMGGYKGFLKEYGICIKWISKVKTEVLNSHEYPATDWQG